jgi:hypothetical protein
MAAAATRHNLNISDFGHSLCLDAIAANIGLTASEMLAILDCELAKVTRGNPLAGPSGNLAIRHGLKPNP